ncbi:MAG: 5-formyltetrahydrofolate cyclo-ligase [Pseudohongiellaceae bacterium]
MISSERAKLRTRLRQARRELSQAERSQAARRLYRLVVHQRFFINARRIAFYIPADGEIDLLPLLGKALEMNKHCYLPVLSRHKPYTVSFAPYQAGDPLHENRWGIPEPVMRPREFVTPESFNLVFVPLVGFDSWGNRLGMGKAFYDRTFAFRKWRGRPLLVGMAHECQRVDKIPTADWDVGLDVVVSDRRIYWKGEETD